MQNFTFGRKGTNWFLFAFLLLIGTLPSFGQNDCPDPDNFSFSQAQSFCFTQTVAELDTDEYPVYQTEDNENDTQPIPEDELLVDGETYYVGGESGDCERIAITVAVDSTTRPSNDVTGNVANGFEITSCTPADFNSGDLADLFNPDQGYTIEVYDSEFGTTPFTGNLQAGGSYYVAQVPNNTNECPSLRVAVGFNPNQIEAPATQNAQVLCEEATVADLVAEGTYNNTQAIRWYRSQNAVSPLAETTKLISGQTYYVGQVVNERGNPMPPCETPAADRAAVTVTLEAFDAGPDVSETLCQSDLQARIEAGESPTAIFTSYITNVPANASITFNPSISSIEADYNNNPFQTFTTTATVTTDAGCEDDVQIALEVVEEFEAGDDITTTLCRSDLPENPTEAQIEAFLRGLLSADADTNGTFDNETIAEITNTFNSGDGIGTYTTTYTVGAGTDCEDTANLTVTVSESIDFELVEVVPLCNGDIPALVNAIPEDVEDLFLENFGANIPEGQFEEGDIQAVINQYNQNNIGTFTATYIPNIENSCTAPIELSRTVVSDANAGNDVEGSICLSEVIEIVEDFDPINPDATLTDLFERFNWNGDINGTFDPSAIELGLELFNYYQNDNREPSLVLDGTYTVGDATSECGTDTANFSITVLDDQEAVAEAVNPILDVCTSEATYDLFENALTDDTTLGGIFTLDGEVFEGTTFDATALGEGTYDFTYTVSGENAECVDGSATANFTINVVSDFNLEGPITDILCRVDLEDSYSETIVENYFLGLLSGEVSKNGSFDDNSIAEMTARYNNGDGLGTYTTTYTVGEGTTCESSVDIVVTVQPSGDANAGDIEDQVVCSTDGMINLSQYLSGSGAQMGGTFSGDGVTNGMFDASVGPNENGYEITYTVDETVPCVTPGTTDSASFNIQVIDEQEAFAEANNQTINLCTSETTYDLYDALTDDTTPGGSYTLNGEAFEGSSFDATTVGEGSYDFNYTVSEDDLDCVNGTANASFTVNVTTDFDFGDQITDILCESEVPANLTAAIIENYYLDLVSGLPSGGTFSTSAEDILAQYNANPFDTFTTTYTVETGDCQGSVEVSVTVQEEGPADAGEIDDQVACTTDGMIDLSNYLEGSGAQMGGTFSGEGVEDGMFDASMEIGDYEITYTVDDSAPCVEEETEDSEMFMITIIEPGEAVAEAMDDTINVCTSETSYNLNNALSEDSTLGGTFFLDGEEIEGTTFDASTRDEGPYNFSYTVSSEDADCIEGSATTDFTINVTSDFDFGDEITVTLCESEVPEDLTAEIIENYYEGLVSGLPSGGTFSTSAEDILAQYNANPFDTFTTTYTVETGDCQGSVQVSVTVQAEGDANAGNIADQVVCSTEGMIDLSDYLAGSGAQLGGTFTGDGVTNGMFDTSVGPNENGYEITYTVNETVPCVTPGTSDSSSFTIQVIDEQEAVAEANNQTINVCTSEASYDLYDALTDATTPGGSFSLDGETFTGSSFDAVSAGEGTYEFTYTVGEDNLECVEGSASATFTVNVTADTFDAGEDANLTVCVSELDSEPTLVEVRNYFLNLLSDGVPTNGTFEPGMEEIRQEYLNNPIGTFTTTYTLGGGSCSDSAVLTVEVIDAIDANAGEIEDQTLCSSDADLNLYTLLSEDANPNGVFEGYENGIFSPSTIGAGTYEVTYSVTEDAPCVVGEASTTFTIEVLQGANAGEDMQVTICDNQGAQNLFDYISADADMDGTFSDLADGIFDPAEFEAGSYEFTYTVTSDAEQCGGDDVATITVDLFVAPEAPTTGDAVAFCAIDGETVSRLEANGNNLTWYSDADLTMMVNDDDLLVNGDYYVTQTSDEGCESEAAMIMVNIVDSPAPTISSDYELCTFDNPTLADLTAEINETGEVTWYESADSMTALSNNAMLTDGTTYYATLISDNGCESSERLAVTVTLEDCALLFPEAITPNGDGRNDRLVIENIESEYPNYNITIFNRWGNAVYKGNASTPTWDGTSNQSGSLGDDVLPVGVYFYVVDFNDGSTEPRQGKVYLNR